MDIARTLISQRFVSFFRKFQKMMSAGSKVVIGQGILCGIILLTFTA
jgi:hypothetical protein